MASSREVAAARLQPAGQPGVAESSWRDRAILFDLRGHCALWRARSRLAVDIRVRLPQPRLVCIPLLRGVLLMGAAVSAIACAAEVAPMNPRSPPPGHAPDATLASLRALVTAAPAGLRIVHELTSVEVEGAPKPGALSWVTTLHLPMSLQIAAAGPVAVTLDGALVFETAAPAVGALVPAAPLAVARGELVIHVESGPAVVGYVRAIVDENPPASAVQRPKP
jgi:hypothetical protein